MAALTTGSERSRACVLRRRVKAGENLDDDDAAWLATYEGRLEERAASRITHTEERMIERGPSSTAEALAVALAAREEGRRVDHLVERACSALERACGLYHQMCEDLLARSRTMEEAQMGLLTGLREHFLARVQAEGEMVQAMQAQQDPIEALAASMLPLLAKRLGSPSGEKNS